MAYRKLLENDLVVNLYRERMQIEQSFRDFKAHLGLRGLNLQIDIAARMGRLLLAFCLAYVLCVLLGESPLGEQARRGFEIPRRIPRHGTRRTLSALKDSDADSLPSRVGRTGYRSITENNLEGDCTTSVALSHSTLPTPRNGTIKTGGGQAYFSPCLPNEIHYGVKLGEKDKPFGWVTLPEGDFRMIFDRLIRIDYSHRYFSGSTIVDHRIKVQLSGLRIHEDLVKSPVFSIQFSKQVT